jgi:hypothetical protein
MRLIKNMDLTTHQARELSHLGFIVRFLGVLLTGDKDRYAVYVS